jgi:hypothetical protein
LPTSLAGLDTWGPAAIVAPSNSNGVLQLEQRSAEGGLAVWHWEHSIIFAAWQRSEPQEHYGFRVAKSSAFAAFFCRFAAKWKFFYRTWPYPNGMLVSGAMHIPSLRDGAANAVKVLVDEPRGLQER